MENSTEHRPEPGEAWCHCGAQEVFFEGYALDPGDLGPTTGYGCEALGRPYPRTLDRVGWHIASKDTRQMIAQTFSDVQLERIKREDPDRLDAVLAFL